MVNLNPDEMQHKTEEEISPAFRVFASVEQAQGYEPVSAIAEATDVKSTRCLQICSAFEHVGIFEQQSDLDDETLENETVESIVDEIEFGLNPAFSWFAQIARTTRNYSRTELAHSLDEMDENGLEAEDEMEEEFNRTTRQIVLDSLQEYEFFKNSRKRLDTEDELKRNEDF